MSQWTHVCGCVRVDYLPFIDGNEKGKDFKYKLKEIFGKTCNWKDSRDIWNNCNVPCGSEGSIQYDIEHTACDNSVSWGVVYIWGDLRDYENANAIYEWIKKATETLIIRSCSVKIDVEYQHSYLVYDHFDDKKIETFIEMKELY